MKLSKEDFNNLLFEIGVANGGNKAEVTILHEKGCFVLSVDLEGVFFYCEE